MCCITADCDADEALGFCCCSAYRGCIDRPQPAHCEDCWRAVISSLPPPPPIGFCRRTLRATTLRTDSTFAFTQLLPPWRPTLSLELCSCTSERTGKCTFERHRRRSCLPLQHCKELFIFYFVSCSFYFKMILEFFWSLFHKNVLIIFLNS